MAAPTCLILRPGAAADATARRVAARGWHPVVLPCRTVAWLDAPIPPCDWQAIAATSGHGLHALSRIAAADHPGLYDLPVLAVGDASAETARQLGWSNARSAAGDVAALSELVCRMLQPDAGPILYPRGQAVAGDLEGSLTRAGFEVAAQVLYETRPAPGFATALRTILSSSGGSILVHAPSAGRDLADAASGIDASRWTVVCLSDNVAASVAGPAWAAVVVAERPDEAALHDALQGPA